jgi:translation initiation factor eIF-2B subunit alpha
VESYKFARMYPLSQRDATEMATDHLSAAYLDSKISNHFDTANTSLPANVTFDIPSVDFTPHSLITLLFTDLGVLTPAAVSDELIRLYQ